MDVIEKRIVDIIWRKTFLLTRENKFGVNREHKANTKKPFYYDILRYIFFRIFIHESVSVREL